MNRLTHANPELIWFVLRYMYAWADRVFLQARMEDHGECMLVLIGGTPEGKKELIGFQVGCAGERAELA